MTGPSTYWADADPAYIAHQQSLGRDTSEYKPEIRMKWAEIKGRQRMTGKQIARQALGAPGSGPLFGAEFGSQRMPWYRRLVLRLRGWDVS